MAQHFENSKHSNKAKEKLKKHQGSKSIEQFWVPSKYFSINKVEYN